MDDLVLLFYLIFAGSISICIHLSIILPLIYRPLSLSLSLSLVSFSSACHCDIISLSFKRHLLITYRSRNWISHCDYVVVAT